MDEMSAGVCVCVCQGKQTECGNERQERAYLVFGAQNGFMSIVTRQKNRALLGARGRQPYRTICAVKG